MNIKLKKININLLNINKIKEYSNRESLSVLLDKASLIIQSLDSDSQIIVANSYINTLEQYLWFRYKRESICVPVNELREQLKLKSMSMVSNVG